METTKKKIISLIQKLPNEAGYEEAIEIIHFQQQVELGLKQLDEGKKVSHEELRKRLEKWLK